MAGKEIQNPMRISFSGWKTVGKQVVKEIGRDNVSIVSAGVAFFAFLAIFPAIMALISIYGLATDPHQMQHQLTQLASVMPQQAFEILKTRIQNLMATPSNTLGWSTVIGILFSIWSANKGTKSLFVGVDMAYDTIQDRGFFKLNALATLFTLGAIVMLLISMAIIVGFPAFVDKLGLPVVLQNIISWFRWIFLAGLVVYYLCMVYKVAPARAAPRYRWVLPGALISTLLWLIACWGFSFYVSNFGNYGEMYGSISAVVILLLWLYLTCFIILLGAEINSEIVDYVQPGAQASYKISHEKEFVTKP